MELGTLLFAFEDPEWALLPLCCNVLSRSSDGTDGRVEEELAVVVELSEVAAEREEADPVVLLKAAELPRDAFEPKVEARGVDTLFVVGTGGATFIGCWG